LDLFIVGVELLSVRFLRFILWIGCVLFFACTNPNSGEDTNSELPQETEVQEDTGSQDTEQEELDSLEDGLSDSSGHLDTAPLDTGIPSGGIVFYAHTSSTLYRLTYVEGEGYEEAVGSFAATITDLVETSDGALYGVGFSSLYQIDKVTGHATLIGSLGFSGANGLTEALDGSFYASSNASTNLYSVDRATGESTAIGQFSPGVTSSGDLVWGPYDRLYMTDPHTGGDRLVTLDPATGEATEIGETGFGGIYGLTRAGGELFGLCSGGELLIISPINGHSWMLHDFNISWWGSS
jgi:hypothetical protein